MRNSNMPKFLVDDAVLFSAIVSDLFPGVQVPEHVSCTTLLFRCLQCFDLPIVAHPFLLHVFWCYCLQDTSATAMSVVNIHPTHLDVHKPDRHSTLCCQMACTMHDVSASHRCTCTVQRRVTQCHFHAAHKALLDLWCIRHCPARQQCLLTWLVWI